MRTFRLNLFTITIILIALGIVMIYSASSIYALEKYKDSFFFLKRHLVFVCLGALLALAVMAMDYRSLRRWARPLVLLAILLLVLVLIPGIGREVAGARRWFRFQSISFQPSEFANLAIIVYLADFIARKEKFLKSFFKGFIPPILVLGCVSSLILLQPDLGTTIALLTVGLTMLFIAGIKLRYLLSLILVSLPALYLLIFNVAYRRMRIMAFLNPWQDPKGSGFQIIQSQIALGSGGIFGTGLGHSKQKLFYLPAAHTDFIFSIIGEELGLIGTLAVLALFIIFIQQGVKIIKNSFDTFDFFLSTGLISMISLKALINIGVSCGLMPTKGLPLPFISYGGSSLLFDIVAVGLLINIARRQDCL